MRIFVTGSSGFIGFHLVKKLLNDGHEVVGIDNHNNYYDSNLKQLRCNILRDYKNYDFHKISIKDLKNYSFIGSNFDLAINLAAQPGVRLGSDKHYLYEENNVIGFESLCKFCSDNGIKKIIYASSSSVYSDKTKLKFDEKVTPLEPKSIYGFSKIKNEVAAKNFFNKSKISFIGLRFFSVYGPFGRPDMAYFSFADAIKKGQKITIYNNGEMSRDMTYIDDIIDGIMQSIFMILDTNSINEIFNLGNDSPITTLELLHLLEEKIGKKADIKFKQSINEASITHANITKAKKILGYQPKYKLKQGILNFLDWHDEYLKS